MPRFLLRWGIRWVVFAGMLAWVLCYTLFTPGHQIPIHGWFISGILLHGICYDFEYIARQIYLDQIAPLAIRAQAQGLFVLVSYCEGQGLGTLLAGWIFNNIITWEGSLAMEQWQMFWTVLIVFGAIAKNCFCHWIKKCEKVRLKKKMSTGHFLLRPLTHQIIALPFLMAACLPDFVRM